jgi:CheY-like chemotaxis protein
MTDTKRFETTRDEPGADPAAATGNRLLIIDDNEPLAHWIGIAARRLGYDVTTADGIASCPDLTDDPPRLILLDLHHGGAERPAAIEDAALARCGAAIVLMSGDSVDRLAAAEAAYRARGWPMAGCLSKPFSLATLRQLLLRYRAEIPLATAAPAGASPSAP